MLQVMHAVHHRLPIKRKLEIQELLKAGACGELNAAQV